MLKMISLRYIKYKKINMIDELTHMMAVGTGWVAILMPVLLIWIIFYYATKNDKEKYKAMIEVAKNLDEAADVEALLESFQEKKKPIDCLISGVAPLRRHCSVLMRLQPCYG